MVKTDSTEPFKWVGGSLCLDFNNTVDWYRDEPFAAELLPTFGRLAVWSHDAGLLSAAEQQGMLEMAEVQPAEAQRALEQAWRLRDAIHRIFVSVARGEAPERGQLQFLNQALTEAPAQIAVTSTQPTFEWVWPAPDRELTRMLRPVAWSASQQLTSPDLAQVRTCANDRCGWLFVDTSRKHNRRWCEMGVCGNRAKARRFRERRMTTAKTEAYANRTPSS